MAKARRADLFSGLKSLVSTYVGGIEQEIIKKTFKSILIVVFAILGIFFFGLAFKDFLQVFLPNYAANAILGIIFLIISLILKIGDKRW